MWCVLSLSLSFLIDQAESKARTKYTKGSIQEGKDQTKAQDETTQICEVLCGY